MGLISLPEYIVPAYIMDAITSAGYDPAFVASDAMVIQEVKTLWAGTDYDPWFEFSQPGDYREIRLPDRVEFNYRRGRELTREALTLPRQAPLDAGGSK